MHLLYNNDMNKTIVIMWTKSTHPWNQTPQNFLITLAFRASRCWIPFSICVTSVFLYKLYTEISVWCSKSNAVLREHSKWSRKKSKQTTWHHRLLVSLWNLLSQFGWKRKYVYANFLDHHLIGLKDKHTLAAVAMPYRTFENVNLAKPPRGLFCASRVAPTSHTLSPGTH